MIGILFWVSVGFVAYVYVGYPLLVSALARLRPKPTRTEYLPQLTLMIAAYNEERVIRDKLRRAVALDYPRDRLQIIVATDGSSDRTPEIVGEFESHGVVLSHSPIRAGKMAAINRAMPLATGEIVVFSDANNHYSPDALRRMAAPFADPGIGAAAGRKTVASDDGLGYSESLYWRYESAIRRAEERLATSISANGEIFAIRRSLFRPAPQWVINDDAYMARELLTRGFDIAYCHDAISSEQVSASAEGEMNRRARMVSGQWALLRHLGIPWRRPLVAWMVLSHKVFRQFVPLASVTALIANSIALVAPGDGGFFALRTPWNIVMASAQVAFYGLALVGRRLGRIGAKVSYVPRFLVDSNIAAVRGFLRYLRGTQTALWDRVERRGEVEVP